MNECKDRGCILVDGQISNKKFVKTYILILELLKTKALDPMSSILFSESILEKVHTLNNEKARNTRCIENSNDVLNLQDFKLL